MCLYARDKAKSISEIQTLPRNCVPPFETWILIPLFPSVGNLELCTLFSTKLSIFRLWFLCREFLNCVLSMRRHLSFSFLVAAFLSKQHIYGSPIFFFSSKPVLSHLFPESVFLSLFSRLPSLLFIRRILIFVECSKNPCATISCFFWQWEKKCFHLRYTNVQALLLN